MPESIFCSFNDVAAEQRSSGAVGFYVAQQNTGILEVSFDPSKSLNDSLSVVATTIAGTQPQWLKAHNDKIYSISRTGFPTNSSTSGGIFVFLRPHSPATEGESLTLQDAETSNGQGGVHCDVSPDGKTLAAANIEASTMAIYPLAEDGSISEATYRFQYTLDQPGPGADDSQSEPFPHESAFDPTGKFLVVPARGEDRVHIYFVACAEKVNQLEDIVVPLGTGPRHTAFRQSATGQTFFYILGELDNTIRVYSVEYGQASSAISFTLHQTISTLGPNLPPTAPDRVNLASEFVFTADGNFAYACNRNTSSRDSDTFVIYSLKDTKSANHLTYLSIDKTLGKIPRHFALSSDPNNKYLAIANEYSNDLIVFERDQQSGLMKEIKGHLSLGDANPVARNGPACILWK
ncbi:hypothetical protein LTR84_001397 [Exophiala bonariae]|uniref:6-phosphogluconolactonase n=1 Tax=Exophiala bonariae TaxID=1690606 RepID=A0AAV9NG75_9EURO|nr:hypothetical protein LTR84_001397 [Exophiala bonariae]